MIHIIAAVGENYELGYKGDLPWPKIKEDFKHFKNLTKGHTVVMGRLTYESIPKKFRPLPGRKNIIVSRNFQEEGIEVVPSIEEAVSGDGEIFLCGGKSIYEEGLKHANVMHISHIPGNYEADVYFPKINFSDYQLLNTQAFQDEGELSFTYKKYFIR